MIEGGRYPCLCFVRWMNLPVLWFLGEISQQCFLSLFLYSIRLSEHCLGKRGKEASKQTQKQIHSGAQLGIGFVQLH